MSSAAIQLIVLAGIALFLVLRLKNVLGTRDGFEGPTNAPAPVKEVSKRRPDLEVIEGGVDHDISDHIDAAGSAGKALAAMKRIEPSFNVTEFMGGARGAYELILMAFEKGELATLKQFLSDDVYDSFAGVVESRAKEGLKIEANFIGVREVKLKDAEFDSTSNEGEITLKFVGELTSVVKDASGGIVEGNPNEVKRQKDVWTFARVMGSADPNWQLVATGG